MVNQLNKRTINSALATWFVAGVCTAQSAQSEGSGSTLQQTSVAANQSNGQAAPNASPLPAGTTLQAELIKPVDERKNTPGDEVLAKVTHDVRVNGSVVIPKRSRLVVHVTEVKALQGSGNI